MAPIPRSHASSPGTAGRASALCGLPGEAGSAWEVYVFALGEWENHGKIMGKSWENHGKIMGKSWENR